MKNEDFKNMTKDEIADWIIEELAEVGIELEKKVKEPIDGEYSSIIGKWNEKLRVNVLI